MVRNCGLVFTQQVLHDGRRLSKQEAIVVDARNLAKAIDVSAVFVGQVFAWLFYNKYINQQKSKVHISQKLF